jgi:hypothetical protein
MWGVCGSFVDPLFGYFYFIECSLIILMAHLSDDYYSIRHLLPPYPPFCRFFFYRLSHAAQVERVSLLLQTFFYLSQFVDDPTAATACHGSGSIIGTIIYNAMALLGIYSSSYIISGHCLDQYSSFN